MIPSINSAVFNRNIHTFTLLPKYDDVNDATGELDMNKQRDSDTV